MNILVTGAAGFIGSHLTKNLLESGHTVHGVDNFDPFYDRSIKEKNLSPLKENSHFSFTEMDLSDEEETKKLFHENSYDLVYHLAAKAGVRPSLEMPFAYLDSNIRATIAW